MDWGSTQSTSIASFEHDASRAGETLDKTGATAGRSPEEGDAEGGGGRASHNIGSKTGAAVDFGESVDSDRRTSETSLRVGVEGPSPPNCGETVLGRASPLVAPGEGVPTACNARGRG
jgi:hypothetical protein